MTLNTPQGTTPKSPGSRNHWHLFDLYKETSLVQAIAAGISQNLATLAGRPIDSGILGARILKGISLEDHPDAAALAPESLAPLFGMVLWNHLASLKEVWYFRKFNAGGQTRARMRYFQGGLG